jgi:hypothetical protein
MAAHQRFDRAGSSPGVRRDPRSARVKAWTMAAQWADRPANLRKTASMRLKYSSGPEELAAGELTM